MKQRKFILLKSSCLILIAGLLSALKLCGFICASWVWVLSPLWLPFALMGIMLLLLFALVWVLLLCRK